MFKVHAEITIGRPIEEVFTFIAENENDPQWCVPVVETTRISGDKPGDGARYSFASKTGFFKAGGEFEITEFESPTRIGWLGTSPFGKYTGYYQLESEKDGSTNLREHITFEYQGLWKLFESIHSGQFAKNYDLQLNRLKRLLESVAA
jgi:uncharacterized protein YndB with AHSA1/START domain